VCCARNSKKVEGGICIEIGYFFKVNPFFAVLIIMLIIIVYILYIIFIKRGG